MLPGGKLTVEKTTSQGLHVYLFNDNPKLFNTQRNIKCYTCDDFDLDIFVSDTRSMSNGNNIIISGSRCCNKFNQIKTYSIVRSQDIEDIPDDKF